MMLGAKLLVYFALIQSLLALKLVSWNILAPSYAPHTKYPWSQPIHLSWSYRRAKIVELLQSEEPDIICLQEVELAYLDGLTEDLPQYTAIVQNVTRGHPIANVILLGPEWHVCAAESRSRALIAVVETDGQHLLVASVHLEAGNGQEETRFYQVQSLMKRLQHQAMDYFEPTQQTPPLVLVGDFNMRHSSPVYHLLSEGQLPSNHAIKALATKLPTSWPLLPLTDAYRHCPPKDGKVRVTYTGGSVLDYLWVSDSVRVEDTWRSHRDASVRRPHGWPSEEHPSDHLPIGATLSIRQQSD